MNSEEPRMHYTQTANPKSEFISFINDHLDIDSNDLSVGEVGCSNGIRLEILKKNLNAKKKILIYMGAIILEMLFVLQLIRG